MEFLADHAGGPETSQDAKLPVKRTHASESSKSAFSDKLFPK